MAFQTHTGIFSGKLPLSLLLILQWRFASAGALDLIDREAPELTCSEGLTDCHMSPASPLPPDPDDDVNVKHVQLKVVLCCPAMQNCEPCLQVIITVQVVVELDLTEEDFEEPGHNNDHEELFGTIQTAEGSGQTALPEPGAFVCLSSPGSTDFCKKLQFKTSYSRSDPASQQPTLKLWLTEKVMFGIHVVVQVYAHSEGAHIIQNITIPSLEEVCAMDLGGLLNECDAPRLRAVTDRERNVVVLQLEEGEVRKEELMCQTLWNEVRGELLAWPKGKSEMVISSNFVAPCLCFQVWWKGKELRRLSCPFKNQLGALESMRHNVSVHVGEARMWDGGTGLSWNVSSPCRLEAEVWLCKKEPAGGQCEEVTGSRHRLHSHVRAGWSATSNGHWTTGEFNASSHPLLCVQLKIHGMESYLEPHCPFAKSRWRWSLPLLLGSVLICLVILGACFIRGLIKGGAWRWLKEDDVKGAVGGGHVVLLYQPDDDRALPELMSHLGSSLQALGLGVSLDLWSRAELGALGPVPWLHSRLNRLQRHGGKVVLVLTPAAWIRAEEWGAHSWDRNCKVEEEEEEETRRRPCADVFTASLSCILADYLQGSAGERFMLVQFESFPPEPPGGFRPLPELFRGLHVYSLPSQSLGFLTELAGCRQMGTGAAARRKRAWGLRMASRALARGLSGFTTGATVRRLAGVSHQGCVGVRVEDSGETMPLQPCEVTPPFSPNASPQIQ